MMATGARSVVFAALCAASIGGCFPEEKLNPPDATVDAPSKDVGPDAPSMDSPAMDRPDAAVFDAPVKTPDAPPADVTDAGRCALVPREPVPAMAVYERLPDATDFAFDGAGQLVVASLRDVNSIGAMGVRSVLYSGLAGDVTALRFTPAGDLVMALVPPSLDGGAPGEGGIYTAVFGDAGTPTLRAMVGRPGGLAVDAEGTVWFSDAARNRVSRMTLRAVDGGVEVAPMITDVMAPTWLAFDPMGRAIYVASTSMGGSLYRVSLTRTVLGDLMPGDAEGVLRDVGAISGLAVDVCGNVYMADERAGRVVRAGEPWMGVTPIVTDVPGARALAFGQGGTFDADTLFFLSGGAVRAASVGAPGVPLPVPMR